MKNGFAFPQLDHAKVFQVVVGQVGKEVGPHFIFRKAFGMMFHAELLQPFPAVHSLRLPKAGPL